jgi:hypothetical protein
MDFNPAIIERKASEIAAKERYFRVAASDMSVASDALPGYNDNASSFQKRFQHAGDRIFCETIDGGALWGVRLGATDNPVIRLRPGRTIKKRFRSFTLLCTTPKPPLTARTDFNGFQQVTSIEIYVSTGDLIQDSSPEYGKGFGCSPTGRIDCVANTTKQLLLKDYNNPGGFPNIPGIAQARPGRHGATLVIRNAQRSGNTPLYLANVTQVFAGQIFDELWRLYPGETLTLDLDGSIQQSFRDDKMIGTPDVGLCVYTKAGTCLYDWMISRLDVDPAPAFPQQWPDTGWNLG